jgi:hypothetical protein
VLHLRLVKLVLNNFGSFLFALVHLLKSLVHFTVIVLHLELIILNPALFHLIIMFFASLLQVNLCVTLLQHVAQHHLRVKCLHLILRVMHLLIRLL